MAQIIFNMDESTTTQLAADIGVLSHLRDRDGNPRVATLDEIKDMGKKFYTGIMYDRAMARQRQIPIVSPIVRIT